MVLVINSRAIRKLNQNKFCKKIWLQIRVLVNTKWPNPIPIYQRFNKNLKKSSKNRGLYITSIFNCNLRSQNQSVRN